VNLLGQSLTNTWAPFVLIVGLLFIGHVAANEGLFSYVGARCAQLPGGDVELFVVTMVAVALVTAVLNLDTAVVFMTPVALHAARTRSADETAFLYGTVLMTNSASLLLIGSNLTNLLVFASRPVQGIVFARHMALPWALSVLVTILVVVIWRWTSQVLLGSGSGCGRRGDSDDVEFEQSRSTCRGRRGNCRRLRVVGEEARRPEGRPENGQPCDCCTTLRASCLGRMAGPELDWAKPFGGARQLIVDRINRRGYIGRHQQPSRCFPICRSSNRPSLRALDWTQSRTEPVHERSDVYAFMVSHR
jgi:hypothetical protein